VFHLYCNESNCQEQQGRKTVDINRLREERASVEGLLSWVGGVSVKELLRVDRHWLCPDGV